MKKSVLSVLSITLVLILAILCLSGCSSEEKDPKKTSAKTGADSPEISGPALPDPDAYFNNQLLRYEDNLTSQDNWQYISFKTDVNGQQALKDYLELLSDSKYNLELTTEKEKTDSALNSSVYGFTYKGEEDVSDVYYKYFDIQSDLVVIFQKNENENTFLLSLYFDSDAFEIKDSGDRTKYSLKDLSGKSNSGANSETNNSGANSGSNNSDANSGANNSGTNSGSSKPSAVSGPTLPSPDEYFNNQLTRNEDHYSETYDSHCLSFVTDYDGQQAIFDYVALLSDPKYNLKLTNTTDNVIYTLLEYTYCFTYTGTEEITDVYNKTIDEDGNNVDLSGDLIVFIQKNGSAGTVMLSLYYAEDSFEFKDFGDRTKHTIVNLGNDNGSGSNSNSNSNSGSSNDYGSALDCITCDGSKNCQECGGDGLLWSSATDSEKRDCPKCLFNKGKCSTCKGTGKRF